MLDVTYLLWLHTTPTIFEIAILAITARITIIHNNPGDPLYKILFVQRLQMFGSVIFQRMLFIMNT